MLTDVSALDLSTELFGRRQTLPVALAPIGCTSIAAIDRGALVARTRPTASG